jgi:hypothetical protein
MAINKVIPACNRHCGYYANTHRLLQPHNTAFNSEPPCRASFVFCFVFIGSLDVKAHQTADWLILRYITSPSATVCPMRSCEQSDKNCACPSFIHEWHLNAPASLWPCVSTLGRNVGFSVSPFHDHHYVLAGHVRRRLLVLDGVKINFAERLTNNPCGPESVGTIAVVDAHAHFSVLSL